MKTLLIHQNTISSQETKLPTKRNKCAIIGDGLSIGSYDGHCLKFNKPTRAWPGQATMHACFEHRKAEIKS